MSLMPFSVSNTFDGTTVPNAEDFTFPYTFDEPIPFSFEMILDATRISDGKSYRVEIKEQGYLTRYNSATDKYPCLWVSPTLSQAGGFNAGAVFSGVTGYQKEYLDGQQIASYNVTSFNTFSLTPALNVYSGISVQILNCSLPVIFKEYNDTIDYSVSYYYLNERTSGDTNAWVNRKLSDGYVLEYIYNAIADETPLVEYYYYGQAE